MYKFCRCDTAKFWKQPEGPAVLLIASLLLWQNTLTKANSGRKGFLLAHTIHHGNIKDQLSVFWDCALLECLAFKKEAPSEVPFKMAPSRVFPWRAPSLDWLQVPPSLEAAQGEGERPGAWLPRELLPFFSTDVSLGFIKTCLLLSGSGWPREAVTPWGFAFDACEGCSLGTFWGTL